MHILHIYFTLLSDSTFESLLGFNLMEITGKLFGCDWLTVKKCLETEGDYADKRKGRIIEKKSIPEKYRSIFQEDINRNLNKGVILTTTYFKRRLAEEKIYVSRSNVHRKLKEWGVKWGRLTQRDLRRRTKEVLEKRDQYLAEIAKLEEVELYQRRVYLDESYVNKNHSLSHGWFDIEGNREIFKPTGKGRRIAIMAAIDQEGWVGSSQSEISMALKLQFNGVHEYGSIRYWEVKKKEENVGNVDTDLFLKYFKEQIIPYMTERSIIVLDNAKYHVSFDPGLFIPNSSCRKLQLFLFLKSKKIKDVSLSMKKDDLLKLAKKHYEQPKSLIEKIAELNGHRIFYFCLLTIRS